MREIGTVISVSGNTAKVAVDKKNECAKCGLCLFKDGVNKAEFIAFNDISAKCGDTVVMERERNDLLGVFLAFFVPLILIGLSVLINYTLVGKELFIPIFSVAAIAIWYMVLAAIDKKLKKLRRYVSRITEIIKPNEEQKGETI